MPRYDQFEELQLGGVMNQHDSVLVMEECLLFIVVTATLLNPGYAAGESVSNAVCILLQTRNR